MSSMAKMIEFFLSVWHMFLFSRADKSLPESVTGTPYDQLTIGVPKEIHAGERRVALSPEATKQLVKQGFKVVIEEGAGAEAKFLDADYIAAGAAVKSAKDALSSDIVLKVRHTSKLTLSLLTIPSPKIFQNYKLC